MELIAQEKNGGKLYSENDVTIAENWTEDASGNISITDTTSYREPDAGTSSDDLSTINTILGTSYTTTEEFDEVLNKDFSNMIDSVGNYRGFYVGRYETSLADSTVIAQGSGYDAQSIANVLSVEEGTNSLGWYGLYAIQKKYSSKVDSVQSSMMWGSQYDQIMKWIANNGIDVTSSTPPVIEVTEDTETTEETANTTETETTTETVEPIVKNGSAITGNPGYNDKLNNIYDLYGAHQELTLESVDSNSRVQRGGSADLEQKPTYRQNMNSDSTTTASSRITLFIEEPAVLEKVQKLGNLETAGMILDDYGNLRYYTANPSNYVEFNRYGELWRILGIFDIDGEQKIKLVRDESIGSYSYDTSDQDTYYGYGMANWHEADLMKLLNPDYETEPIGGSLYWSSESGYAFNARANGYIECDFSSTGLTEEGRNMIAKSTFYLGGMTTAAVTAKTSYENERGNTLSTVVPSNTWKGYVGLMYPSDYGYAMDSTYWETNIASYPYNYIDDYNFLYKAGLTEWHLTYNSNHTYQVFGANNSNTTVMSLYNSCDPRGVRPVVYLKPEVIIESGTGTKTDPYVLSLYE